MKTWCYLRLLRTPSWCRRRRRRRSPPSKAEEWGGVAFSRRGVFFLFLGESEREPAGLPQPSTEKPSFVAVVFPLSLTSCSFLEALPPKLSAPPSTSLSPSPWHRRPTPQTSGHANAIANCCSSLRRASAARCSSTNASAPAGTTRSRIPTDPGPPFWKPNQHKLKHIKAPEFRKNKKYPERKISLSETGFSPNWTKLKKKSYSLHG